MLIFVETFNLNVKSRIGIYSEAQLAPNSDRTFCYDITCRYTMLCSLFIKNVDNLIKEPIMSKQKCQHVELSFNLIMTIGAESFEILDMIMQHLTHTKNNYLSPYKFPAINGKQNGSFRD